MTAFEIALPHTYNCFNLTKINLKIAHTRQYLHGWGFFVRQRAGYERGYTARSQQIRDLFGGEL